MRRRQQPIPREQSARIERVLLVDDDGVARGRAAAMLIAAGHVVIEASDGTQALVEFEQHRPALILLDAHMPGMDGFETCRAIRSLRGARAVPVVLLATAEDHVDEHAVRHCEANDVLRKPLERSDLVLRVGTLMSLCSQRNALEETQRRRQQLAAHVVHDLRIPLTTVNANLQYLLRDPKLGEHAAGAARDALDAADAASRMAADLLDLAIAEQGVLIPRLSAIELPTLLEDVRRQALHRMEGEIQHNISISTRLDRPTVVADRALLQRVVENLLDNAIKYAPSGDTIHVEARTFAPEWIELRVRDCGPGIPDAYRERVFEQYIQLDREAELHLRAGRGLGLAFCKVAVETHGGRIWVEDNAPCGACFCVRLPNQVRDGSVQ